MAIYSDVEKEYCEEPYPESLANAESGAMVNAGKCVSAIVGRGNARGSATDNKARRERAKKLLKVKWNHAKRRLYMQVKPSFLFFNIRR